MKKRLCGLCLAILLLTGGCTNPPTKQTATVTTLSTAPLSTASHSTVTQTSTTSIPSTSIPVSSISEVTSTSTQAIVSTSLSTQGSITEGSTTSSAATVTTRKPTASSTTATSNSSATATTTVPSTETVTFKATVRESSNNQTVSGVRVTVYVNGNDTPAGSGDTDHKGVARITLTRGTSYRVELSNLPSGYEANAYYTFSTNTVNITIRKAAVQNEKDHSSAQYEEGRKMTDFSLTDIDGNTYRLSSLLKKKQLIVLDFWYTTCEPCKMEFPYFESAVQKYGDALSLLAINPINDNAAMAALRQQLNASPATAVTFPMLKDTCNLHLGFGVTAYPTTVFIDSNGIILDIHRGAYANEEAFLAAIERFIR